MYANTGSGSYGLLLGLQTGSTDIKDAAAMHGVLGGVRAMIGRKNPAELLILTLNSLIHLVQYGFLIFGAVTLGRRLREPKFLALVGFILLYLGDDRRGGLDAVQTSDHPVLCGARRRGMCRVCLPSFAAARVRRGRPQRGAAGAYSPASEPQTIEIWGAMDRIGETAIQKERGGNVTRRLQKVDSTIALLSTIFSDCGMPGGLIGRYTRMLMWELP